MFRLKEMVENEMRGVIGKAMEELLESGADTEITDSDGRTALKWSSKRELLEVVKVLIAGNAI